MLEWKDELADASELTAYLKAELFEQLIYAVTPQGRVIDLPRGSTPIDFAYRLHTELGHRCRGAKVNGHIVPLTYSLTNGERVEIIAAKEGGPSRDWLNPDLGFIKSDRARAKVRQWFNSQQLTEAVSHGRALLDKELQRLGKTGQNLDRSRAFYLGCSPGSSDCPRETSASLSRAAADCSGTLPTGLWLWTGRGLGAAERPEGR